MYRRHCKNRKTEKKHAVRQFSDNKKEMRKVKMASNEHTSKRGQMKHKEDGLHLNKTNGALLAETSMQTGVRHEASCEGEWGRLNRKHIIIVCLL